jgi:hypothetical protein
MIAGDLEEGYFCCNSRSPIEMPKGAIWEMGIMDSPEQFPSNFFRVYLVLSEKVSRSKPEKNSLQKP